MNELEQKALERELLDAIVELAIREDVGSGDMTSRTAVHAELQLEHVCRVKQDGVIAGLGLMQQVFARIDPAISCELLVSEGAEVVAGTEVALVRGSARSILTAERTALNFLQRMSGIATEARRYVRAIEGTGAKILDTRKTAPGLRAADKLAVRLGGGVNHRFGLFDMIMIKDNHIAAAGGITAALMRVQRENYGRLPVEVEVASVAQLTELLPLVDDPGVDRVLLDNMSLVELRECVALVDGRVPLEASGNVTLKTVGEIAATGVEYISVGSLTHSVAALDIHLDSRDEGDR
ncbi:carboxylating nicotinate-nucleotide diphosphorylase [Spirochaeta africana]|uniref:Probable nicotinate-nucleotide pyrophosphorylase [carboxylating] n=1 Tax=Spirochaeta africana (strain ATCC 700263 / DSM 8902 / Z-7692) TaxID=889378 RepID=H9UMW4_SPIAZ|nr:carboxylating nicotinate-nucleotide diphosphorylase [Spirochaeta africana]AFG38857.1 nicotinate-nucleotide pyrophosphorylase [Spirochaeta africana DSM 8902]